jgi:hypothetical protein
MQSLGLNINNENLTQLQQRFFAEEEDRRKERSELRLRGGLPPLKQRLVRRPFNPPKQPDEAISFLLKLKEDVDKTWYKFDEQNPPPAHTDRQATAEKRFQQQKEQVDCKQSFGTSTTAMHQQQENLPVYAASARCSEGAEISLKDLISEFTRLRIKFPGRCGTLHPIERSELVAAINSMRKLEEIAAAAKKASDDEREQRIGTAEAKKWARNKSLHTMLNSINVGEGSILSESAQDLLLFEWDPPAKVLKAYKRALLKIHPDKHAGDGLRAEAKATELFKVLLYTNFNHSKTIFLYVLIETTSCQIVSNKLALFKKGVFIQNYVELI